MKPADLNQHRASFLVQRTAELWLTLPQNVNGEFSCGSKSNWMNPRKRCPLGAIKYKSFHHQATAWGRG